MPPQRIPGIHMSSLSWWLALALAVLLWFINVCMTVIGREVVSEAMDFKK